MQQYTYTKKITGIAKSFRARNNASINIKLKNKNMFQTVHFYKSEAAIKRRIKNDRSANSYWGKFFVDNTQTINGLPVKLYGAWKYTKLNK
tara:strand:- start:1241 stop:1513 length:273 start_codon:yes stop_codon:yes gene_type:complete